MLSNSHVTAFAACSILFMITSARAQGCISSGVDFQAGGTYFQNSLSSDNFTFVSEYEHCQNDLAYNILQAPDGTEWECSKTPLQPDDTPELSTCPVKKSQLTSGEWTIFILSNNGNGDSIAYERDFDLVVGPQQTTTFTPTVTLSSTTTPVYNSTSTSTYIVTSVAVPNTVTSPASVLHPSTTVTPKTSTTTSTKTLATLTVLKPTLSVSQIVRTATASCTTPKKVLQTDKVANTMPTLAAELNLKTKNARPRRSIIPRPWRRPYHTVKPWHKPHHTVDKRAPDEPTATVTEMNTSNYVTSTTTIFAPTTTITVVTITTSTTTSTPPPVTVMKGTSTAAVVTVTAPTPIKTYTTFTIGVTTKTVTLTAIAIVTTTITPPAVAASCTSAGGTI